MAYLGPTMENGVSGPLGIHRETLHLLGTQNQIKQPPQLQDYIMMHIAADLYRSSRTQGSSQSGGTKYSIPLGWEGS